MSGLVRPRSDTAAAVPAHLDELLATFWRPAQRGARMDAVGSPTELPWVLEQCIRCLAPDDLWRAYSDGVRVWLVTARSVAPASQNPSAIALELHFIGNDGTTCAAGIWGRSSDTQWSLNAALVAVTAPLPHQSDRPGLRRMQLVHPRRG